MDLLASYWCLKTIMHGVPYSTAKTTSLSETANFPGLAGIASTEIKIKIKIIIKNYD